jgi:hypothetical protein
MASQEVQRVYLLWHTHELEDGEVSEKLLGVYSTGEKAKKRIESARKLPGFGKSLPVSRCLDT